MQIKNIAVSAAIIAALAFAGCAKKEEAAPEAAPAPAAETAAPAPEAAPAPAADAAAPAAPVAAAKAAAAPAPEENLYVSPLSVEQKVEIALSVGEETLTVEELTGLFTAKQHPVVYDGFEPSGRMHIAQGLLRAHNVNKFVKAGVKFKFWVADWFALMNLKLGGDLKKIQKDCSLIKSKLHKYAQ